MIQVSIIYNVLSKPKFSDGPFIGYVESLPSGEQLKRDFVCTKGRGTCMSLIRLLRSMTVAQVERYTEGQIILCSRLGT